MKIDIRFLNLDSSAALRAHAVRRAHLHLSRYGDEIESVQLRIRDVNGPKGGPDKYCKVVIRGHRIVNVTVDDLDQDPYRSVELAVERAARAVGRHLERVRVARIETLKTGS